jgi:hypothetical protein
MFKGLMNRAGTFNGGARAALFAVALTFLIIPAVARAQHQGHDAHKPPAAGATPTPSPSPTTTPTATPPPSTMPMPAQGESHEGHAAEAESAEDEGLMVMSDSGMGIRVGSSARNVMSMGAMGSGTSWQPAAGPMSMYHKVAGEWLVMFHFNLTAGVNRQGGPRGVTRAESQNWFMPMAYRKVGRGTLQLRGMFSAEPFTFPLGGSPLLFQTGETYKGEPIVDAQHPHDLLMELSAQYTHPLGERATWFTYFGYPGEPALGPVAFMHRLSAAENPSATLGHHLQDSTHISFGVLTSGFTYRAFKFEGSLFNGREPDENRYDFDAHRWNSRSARLSFMPNKNWALQISHGFLRSPEAHAPDEDIRRTTASVQYNRTFDRGYSASSFVWGRNHVSGHGDARNLNAYTLESTLNFLERNYAYTRLELVDKDELLNERELEGLGVTGHHASFRVGAYTFGGARELWNSEKLSLAVGSDLTFYSKPAALDALYGRNPVSWKLFFRLRPGRMKHDSHATHGTTQAPPSHQH